MQKNPKYKVVPCRHFETPKGCVYKDKCQFAHGIAELAMYQSGAVKTRLTIEYSESTKYDGISTSPTSK
jgi:hypothetical protein